jgi:CRP-like cAMP-binding protein
MSHRMEIAVIRASRWLARQAVPLQNSVCEKLRPFHLSRNAKLFHVEDRAPEIYFIAKGTVVSLVPHPVVGMIPGEVYHAGDWFGLPAALGRRPRLATIEARHDCSLLALTLTDLMQIIKGREDYIMAVLELMSDNSESHMFHGVDLMIADNKLRLCSRLLTLAGRRLTFLPPTGVVIPLSKEELALTSNMSRQTVHEILRELVDEDICELGYGRITIRDTPALARLVSSPMVATGDYSLSDPSSSVK